MKHLKKILTLAVLVVAAVLCAVGLTACGGGDSNPQGLSFYLLDDGTYAVGAGTARYLSTVEIPEKYNGKKVSSFAEEGFIGCAVKELKLNSEITCSLAANPFRRTAIEKVTLKGKTASVIVGENAVAYDTSTATPYFAEVVEYFDGKDGSLIINVATRYGEISGYYISGALNDTTDITGRSEFCAANSYESASLGLYGKIRKCSVDVVTKDGRQISVPIRNAAITTYEYNFAPLNASYPVLVYTLKLHEITEDYTIPTFMCLERYNTYDWDELPEGVSTIPTLTKAQGIQGGFHDNRSVMSAYIKELYELNNDSIFNLYAVDNYGETVLEMLIGNRIPEDQWTATLLSDGTGTAGWLCKTYDVENPAAKAEEMRSEWNDLKELVYDEGYSTELVSSHISYIGESARYAILSRYAYAMVKEQDNIRWWVNRLRAGENLSAINARDSEFTSDIIANTQAFYTNNLLAALSEEEAAAFKKLYKFGDDAFSKATESGKQVMIILGTSWGGEQATFYDNIRMTVELYGDDYVYYYKGHPGYPTELYEGRKQAIAQLKEDGVELEELDNAIAAEIILFFKPDVYVCGWSSTTFESVEAQQMACALYDQTYATATATYRDMIDVFFKKAEAGTTEIKGVAVDGNKTYFVMEFNNTAEYPEQVVRYEKHDFGIYDAEDTSFRFFKTTGEGVIEVDIDGNPIAE